VIAGNLWNVWYPADLTIDGKSVGAAGCARQARKSHGGVIVNRTSIIVVLLVAMLGCAADKSPKDECQELLGVICGRAVTCIPGATDRRDECFDALKRVAGCERVEQHSAMYDACVDRVESQTCSALFASSTSTNIMVFLPPECSDVVDLMQTSPGDGGVLRAGGQSIN